jgi:hypothetical protein
MIVMGAHQNANDLGDSPTRLHRQVDALHNPLEQIVVDRLCQRITA